MRIALAAFAFAAVLGGPALADDAAALHGAAEGFYRVYQTFHPSDGIPIGGDLAKYEPFISPALDALLKQAGDAQARFAKDNKDSPPLVEGDLFSSLFEGASSVAVGACDDDGRRGRCEVALTHTEPGKKPFAWTDTVLLVNTPAGWRVDDIDFGGNWDFGNKGSLSETLKQAIGFQ
jgi:hypothetical protein